MTGLSARLKFASQTKELTMASTTNKPSAAFLMSSWAALLLGMGGFFMGLWNSGITRSEKGFYFIVILYGLFAAVSLQKSIRDRLEGLRVTNQYYGLCWLSLGICAVVFGMGLFNADKAVLTMSEKGFFAMAFALSLFGAVVVQKNTRDMSIHARANDD
jgi:uncharacterized membrane protein YiaA